MLEKQGQAEWPSLPAAKALAKLESRPEGLTEAEAQQRPGLIVLVALSDFILVELEKLLYCAWQRRRGLSETECGRR